MKALLIILHLIIGSAIAIANESVIAIKVGISEYQNLQQAYSKYLRFFEDLENASNHTIRFSLAIGSYHEVLKWRDRGEIDLSVLSAAPVASILTLGAADDRKQLLDTFLGHLIYFTPPEPAQSSALGLDGSSHKSPDLDGFYHTTCIVRADSPFTTLKEIAESAVKPGNNIKFLFVRPYSVSGYIHPRAVLEQKGLQVETAKRNRALDAVFTMEHGNSISMLLNPTKEDKGKNLVAFVLDQTPVNRTGALRRISDRDLDEVKIPQEAFFLSNQLQNFREVKRRLVAALSRLKRSESRNCDATTQGKMCFDTTIPASQWLECYKPLVAEMKKIPLPPKSDMRAVLDDFVTEVGIYKEQHQASRLALVLSGGGAKCAYQAGVIDAISERFAALRKKGGPAPGQFDLVVGTSGGAINALLYALGLEDHMKDAWRALDQGDLVHPAAESRILLGASLAIMIALIVLAIASLLFRKWWLKAASAAIFVFAIAILLYTNIDLTSEHNHWAFHCLLLLKLSRWPLSLTLTAVAIAAFLLGSRRRLTSRLALINVIAAVFLTTSIGLLIHGLFWSDSVSDMEGVKRIIHTKFPQLLSTAVQNSLDADAKLSLLSRELTNNNKLRRDLILTASRLPSDDANPAPKCEDGLSSSSLPSDLYFYFNVKKNLPNIGDNRFISLRSNPDILLHAMLGSSTIYPFFGAQQLGCIKLDRPEAFSGASGAAGSSQTVRNIEIVDGGYSHNSPLEAAISWGATHVLLVEASPRPRYSRPAHLAGHVANAFNYLYDQAQREDYGVRGNVKIYEIAPSYDCDEWFDPACLDKRDDWLDVMDFSGPLLNQAILRGRKDVDTDRPMFVRIPGPPSLVPLETLKKIKHYSATTVGE